MKENDIRKTIKNEREDKKMKKVIRILSLLTAVMIFPAVPEVLYAEDSVNVSQGKSIVYSNGGYTLDLGRAYPIDNIVLGGTRVSSAAVTVSNDAGFSAESFGTEKNISVGKKISSKLYGTQGYLTFTTEKANDGDNSSLFIATPVNYTDVEWLTIDLGDGFTVNRAEVNATTERDYDVYLSKYYCVNSTAMRDGIKMDKTGGKFYIPNKYKYEKFHYARVVFHAAQSSSGKDIRLFEFSVFSQEMKVTEKTTSVFNKANGKYYPNGYAEDHFYRYVKVTGGTGVNRIDVYSPAGTLSYENIAPEADISAPEGASIFKSYPLSNVIDGNYSKFTALNHYDPYVQLDLGKPYDISHTEVYFRRDMNTDREDVRVLLSNDADFNDFYELDVQGENEIFPNQGALMSINRSRMENYRYVRVCEGKSKAFLVLAEIRVFAKEGRGILHEAAKGKIPETAYSPETAYRATDGDIKSYWEGKELRLDLGYCQKTDMIELTGTGEAGVKVSCEEDEEDEVFVSLKDGLPETIPVNKRIRYILIESTDENDIRINDIKVSVTGGAEKYEKASYIKESKNGEFIYDLKEGRIIGHIEPCTADAYISSNEDFTGEIKINNHSDTPVSGRYIRSAEDIDIYLYPAPQMITNGQDTVLTYDTDQYPVDGNTVLCAAYNEENRLLSVTQDTEKNGTIDMPENEDIQSAKLMIWDSINNMVPVFPVSYAAMKDTRPWKEFYVALGSVNGDGSEASPFGSIKEARDHIRTVSDDMQGDIYVYVREGRYLLDEPLTFDVSDSGKNGYRIIYKNYEGESPEISGGKALPGFEIGEGGLWQAYVPGMSSIYGLYVNGRQASLAHTETPITAESFYAVGNYPNGGIRFSSDKLPMLSGGGEVFVRAAKSWMDHYLKVTAVREENGATLLDMRQPYFNKAATKSYHSLTPDTDYLIENAKELLDNPGEFYFDKTTKILYYMPREGENITSSYAEAAYLDTLVQITGSSYTSKVKNISLCGFKMENASFQKVYAGGFTVAQASLAAFGTGDARFFDGAVQIDYADGIEIAGCEITGVTKCGVSMAEGATNISIHDNIIHDTGDGAVSCGRPWQESISLNIVCAKDMIYDNVIYNTGKVNRSAPAVAIYYAQDCGIIHNSITDASYSAISVGWGWDNFPDSVVCRRNRIANNYIHNFNLCATDGGAVYTLGRQSGTTIEGNYIVMDKAPGQLTGTIGLYPDEGSKYMMWRNNAVDINISLEDNIYSISQWTDSIGYNFIHTNYSTVDKIRDNSTDSVFEGVYLYDRDNLPQSVRKIIDGSAMNLNN